MIINSAFSICVFQDTFEDYPKHQQEIERCLEQFQQNNPSVTRSNNGGYQSPATLGTVQELEPLFRFIARCAEDSIRNFNIPFQRVEFESAWFNVNQGQGSHNQMHIHDGILSGVFYINAPQGSGKLNIMNPGMNTLWQGHQRTQQPNSHTAEVISIAPSTGTLYLWPSYVPHSVDTNTQADCVRKSISFNITVS